MNHQTIHSFHVIGLSIRTTNENGQAMLDIPALWKKFMEEQIAVQIPDKINNDLYCLYTDYEKDHTRPYTTILGCQVKSIENIPDGMTGKTLTEGNYTRFTAKGDLAQGIVYNEWVKIWNTALDRAFTADFEVYGEKTIDPANAEVDIFIALQ